MTTPSIPGSELLPPDDPIGRPLDERTTVSLVISCFNEEDVLPTLFTRVSQAAQTFGTHYEVVLVDDGSTDSTWDLIRQCHRVDPRWRGVRLARNFGQQAALWYGLRRATGDVIAVLDADLQDPPEVIPQFLAKWAEGYDVVYAIREKRKEGPLKRLAYFGYYRLLAMLSETPIPPDAGDFGIMDRRVVRAMTTTSEPGPFLRGLRAWVGFRQIGLPYERDRRAAGEVKYTLRKLIDLGLNGVFGFSLRPLRLATYLGLAASATAFAGAVFGLAQRLFPGPFTQIGLPPYGATTTVLVAVLFLGGVQLLCLGILGEYVGRIFEVVKGRPTPTVRDVIGLDEADTATGAGSGGR